ncbi:MAG: hypothetical protein U9N33_00260 [Campylobacterota bacterium]|nr:hypothetical protein [Campylobacterota bacterium]
MYKDKIILTLLSLSLTLFASDPKVKSSEFPQKEIKKQNKEIAKLVAQEISETLPQAVDKYTTLTKIKNIGTTLVYTFEINSGVKSDESIRKEDHSRMKKAITTGVCQSSSKFLAAGINTSYVYISAKTKANLFRFDITQKDCPIVID